MVLINKIDIDSLGQFIRMLSPLIIYFYNKNEIKTAFLAIKEIYISNPFLKQNELKNSVNLEFFGLKCPNTFEKV
jgi:hypothetical protein